MTNAEKQKQNHILKIKEETYYPLTVVNDNLSLKLCAAYAEPPSKTISS